MKYKDGYSYKVEEDFTVNTKVFGYTVNHEYYNLKPNGELSIKRNFSWDGATGFPDIKSVIKGSCAHDCLYQMLRLNLIPYSQRNEADETFKDICLDSGMWVTTAFILFKGVRWFGPFGKEKPTKFAP